MRYFYLKVLLVQIDHCQAPIQVINELAWHNLFAQLLSVQQELKDVNLTIFSCAPPDFKADPAVDGLNLKHSSSFL